METKSSPKSTQELPGERIHFALSNTRLAAERTMMSVLRTGLSFISFGFTIYKFLQYVREAGGADSRIHAYGPARMGLALIGVGLFVLGAGSWQHWQFLRQLQRESAQKLPWSVSLTGALILAAVGVIAFVTVLIRTALFR